MTQPAEKAKPNLVFVFADQWRAQALGYAGDPNVRTPHLDAFARRAVNLTHATAGCPVCSPYRACLMTGQYPHTNGMVVNDLPLPDLCRGPFLAEVFRDAGYDTAYIGKWHMDGVGRSAFVPPERRLGFSWWKGFECTHDYNRSFYYFETPEKLLWPGYDADAQTDEACRYIRDHDVRKPFLLMLSWGPPHNPFDTAPEKFRALYDPARITLRPNVPPDAQDRARRELAGYYAHCSALDACFGRLLLCLQNAGRMDDTIVIFTSDHGDLLGSQGAFRKQRPWEESIRVPFLIHDPFRSAPIPCEVPVLLDAPDLMPTLLGLCGLPVPPTVQGADFSPAIREGRSVPNRPILLTLPMPFHEWTYRGGGREYRGVRTERYTYVRNLSGPWLLYDNEADPYQTRNLASQPEHRSLVERMDALLRTRLRETGDEFLPGPAYVERYGIRLGDKADVLAGP